MKNSYSTPTMAMMKKPLRIVGGRDPRESITVSG